MRGPLEGRGRGGKRRLAAALGCLAALALLAPGCGGDDSSAANAEPLPKVTVVIEDDGYRPAEVRIEAGTRVTWVNASQEAQTAEMPGVGFFEVDRRKLAEQGLFDLHTIQPGEAESLVFETPGYYEYNSSLSDMEGAVQVVASDG